MAEAKRGGQGFILQLRYCYPFLRLVLSSCPSLFSLVKKTSDPKDLMFCKDSGQLVMS